MTAIAAVPTPSALPATMTAVVTHQYGSPDVLRVTEVPRPTPAAGEVLVRVEAAAVCKGDLHLLTGLPYLVRVALPRPAHGIVGQDFAGVVVEVGAGVHDLAVGEAVYGQATAGAFAGYVAAPASRVAPRPARLDALGAAAMPDAGLTALQALRDVGRVQPGQRVLINGASGGVGTAAVQIARAMGAEVTAVCSSRHLERVRALGAARIVDYTRDDFAQLGVAHDVMLDLVGNRSLADCKRALARRGTYISSTGGTGDTIGPVVWMLKVLVSDLVSTRRLRLHLARPHRADLEALAALIDAGQLAPVIEHRFPLAEAAAAMRHVAAGHAQGKTVITMP